jgi:hypothetical protein
MKYIILLFFLLSLPGCGNKIGDAVGNAMDEATSLARNNTEKRYQGRVIKQGVFKVIRSGGIVDSPQTGTGKSIAKPVMLMVRKTDRIPLIKDVYMSFQYRIWDLPEQPAYVDLRRVLKHPPMNLPDGSVSTGADYMIKGRISAGQVIAYTGYGLNESYELVEGEWIFQIWHQDQKLIEQKFITYRPRKEEIADWETLLKVAGKSPPLKIEGDSAEGS